MAQWTQIIGNGWVQWADLRLADACFRHAQLIASTPVTGIEAQKNATRETFRWIGAGCRALDTPPYNSPTIRTAVRAAYGTRGFGTDLSRNDSFWVDGTNPGSAEGISAFVTQARRLYLTQRPRNTADIIEVKIRYLLDQVGEVVDACAAPNGGCYNPAPYWMDNPGAAPRQIFGGEVDWENWGFWDGGSFAWLAAQPVGKVLPPVKWSMDLAKTIADQLVALGALEVLTQARFNAVLLNVRMAIKHRLVSNEALLQAAAAVPMNLEYATWTDQSQSSKVAAQGIIAVGSTLVSAGVSQGSPELFAVGAIIGVAGLALNLAPSSVGPEFTDMFGRPEPVYERPNISGGGGDANSSLRLRIPEPPGYEPMMWTAVPATLTAYPTTNPQRRKLAEVLGIPETSLPPTLTPERALSLINLVHHPQIIQAFRNEFCQLPPMGLRSQAEASAWNTGHPWCPVQRPSDGSGIKTSTLLIGAGILAVAGGVYWWRNR